MMLSTDRLGAAPRTFMAVMACAGSLLVASCRTAPVHDIAREAFTPPPAATMQQIAEAIWAASRREGWRTRDVSPGKTLAEKSVREHRALTEITYDTAGFSLRLVEADNLVYDGTSIHKTYNLWVTQLEKSIQDEIRFRFR